MHEFMRPSMEGPVDLRLLALFACIRLSLQGRLLILVASAMVWGFPVVSWLALGREGISR